MEREILIDPKLIVLPEGSVHPAASFYVGAGFSGGLISAWISVRCPGWDKGVSIEMTQTIDAKDVEGALEFSQDIVPVLLKSGQQQNELEVGEDITCILVGMALSKQIREVKFNLRWYRTGGKLFAIGDCELCLKNFKSTVSKRIETGDDSERLAMCFVGLPMTP